jgi:hypothetical protein
MLQQFYSYPDKTSGDKTPRTTKHPVTKVPCYKMSGATKCPFHKTSVMTKRSVHCDKMSRLKNCLIRLGYHRIGIVKVKLVRLG